MAEQLKQEPFSLAKREKCPGFLKAESEVVHSMGRWCGADDCRNRPKGRHAKCPYEDEHGPHTTNKAGEELSGDPKRSEWCGGGPLKCPECGGDMDKPGAMLGELGEEFCHFEPTDEPEGGHAIATFQPSATTSTDPEAPLLEEKEIQNTLYLLKTQRLPVRLLRVQLQRFGDELLVMRHENENWDRKWAMQLRGELNGKLLEKAPSELLLFVNALLAKREKARAKHPHRPQDPWNKYQPRYLQERLLEEVVEWLKETDFTKSGKVGEFSTDPKKEADELLDMANFAWFRWCQASGTVTGPPPVYPDFSCLKCGRNLEHGEVAHVEHGQLRCQNCLGAP